MSLFPSLSKNYFIYYGKTWDGKKIPFAIVIFFAILTLRLWQSLKDEHCHKASRETFPTSNGKIFSNLQRDKNAGSSFAIIDDIASNLQVNLNNWFSRKWQLVNYIKCTKKRDKKPQLQKITYNYNTFWTYL